MIGVIFGGESHEHDVSVACAKDIARVVSCKLIYIDKSGRWVVDGKFVDNIFPILKSCEVIFPIMHGEYGENGSLQGFLEVNKIPYIGCDVASSALCLDKDLSKRILESHGIKTTPFKTYFSLEEALQEDHEVPCVVKAASQGSSYGTFYVEEDPIAAFKEAFRYSDKVIKEEAIKHREIWCSVLQDGDEIIVSTPCEFVANGKIITYENKYAKGAGVYHVPAKNVDVEALRQTAKQAFSVLGCSGMARVDMFIKEDGEIFVNELNTLPGFTEKSLFPKALIYDGMAYEQIIETLVRNAHKPQSFKDRFANISTTKEGVLM